MKTRIVKLGVIALLSTVMPFTTKAQDKVEASVGAHRKRLHLAWARLGRREPSAQRINCLQRLFAGGMGIGRH